MKFLTKTKDGGPESPVDAYFLFEIRSLCSVALLKFNKGCREAHHTHAFNAFTWFISGDMYEEKLYNGNLEYTPYNRSFLPKITRREKNHRVIADKTSWCFTIRGPWNKTWTEDHNGVITTLTHGRIVINAEEPK